MATDLSVLVDAIAAANRKAGLGQQRRPWLEPLPEVVTLGELPAAGPGSGPGSGHGADIPPIPYGLTDLPHRQARAPLTLDFPSAGHTVIAGAARSGRSSLLRTLAGAVASHASPADVHIYGIDCGAGALLPVSELPHCGAVVASYGFHASLVWESDAPALRRRYRDSRSRFGAAARALLTG